MKEPGLPSGALILSLDFELHWGRPTEPLSDRAVRTRFLRTREVVPRILAVFEEFGVAATWATVGHLFAHSSAEIAEVRPAVWPTYRKPGLSPDVVTPGPNEAEDPFHFAPSLIECIRRTPRQEIGTHTFSHFYCLEAGQSRTDFAADLNAACAIAARRGIELKSIAFPRNQVNEDYRPVLREHGIEVYRGNPPGVWRAGDSEASRTPTRRAARLLDSFVQWTARDGSSWEEIAEADGLANVRATSFLRPFDGRLGIAEEIRFRRIATTLERAARLGRFVHLWWHPHNFAAQPDANLMFLRRILRVFASCRETLGMRSLSMIDAAMAAGETSRAAKVARMANAT